MTENNNNPKNNSNSKEKDQSKVQRKNSGSRSTTKISDFTDFVEIGRGAFGKVYKARHIKNQRQFALKKISKKDVQSHYMVNQLSNQIKISLSLKHDNIIRLYDYFQEDQFFYLVLQLAQQGQLYTKLMKKGRFSQEQTKSYVRDVISAVKYLHSQNPPVIHRDIKPQNLLLQNGRVKLADFGWSNYNNKPRKTYCGTVHYLAPQMIDKSGHDQSLDIWCIGVLVYEFLTGKTPFLPTDAKNELAMKKQIQDNILNLRIQFPADFPTQAKSFVLGMIKRNPKQRMTLQQIQNHPWLASLNQNKSLISNHSMPKIGTSNSISNEQSTVVQALKSKIRQLQSQIKQLKMNGISDLSSSSTTANTQKNINGNDISNEQKTQLMKEVRQLKVTRQMNQKYKQQNDKLYSDLNNKQKTILQLKNKINKLEDKIQDYQRGQSEKRTLEEKLQKYKKQLENSRQNEKKLKEQLVSSNNTIPNRIKNGQRLALSDMNSNQFIEYLQEQLDIISQQFKQNKKILDQVIKKQRTSQQKQNELIRLRIQRQKMKQTIRSQLKQQYQAQKDEIIVSFRNQMADQREKWVKDFQEIKGLYSDSQESSNENSSNIANDKQNDLRFQIRNLKEVNSNYEKTIKNQENVIRDLQEQLKRGK